MKTPTSRIVDFSTGETPHVTYTAVTGDLDDLAAAPNALADIGDDKARLIKGADEILALRMIDRHLAPNGGISHSDQGGRHLNQGQTAKEGGGDKAGEVAHHAPT